MNQIESFYLHKSESFDLLRVENCHNIRENYLDYLHDESRMREEPVEFIYFPKTINEVIAAVKECFIGNKRFVVSGGRTGIVGGAVSINADAIISLERMKSIVNLSDDSITVHGGITLDELNRHIQDNSPNLFYPVDPTETSASIGGTISTNASGARTYFYGPTRKWIKALKIVLPDGSLLMLRRGDINADKQTFIIQLPECPMRKFSFPDHEYPKCKNTAGYLFQEGMDAIDLFIGSEGTLGVIVEAELNLAKKPLHRLYTTIWADSENQAIEIAGKIRLSENLHPLAIEYFDPNSIKLLKNRKIKEGKGSSIPHIENKAQSAIFVDLKYENESDLVTLSEKIEAILDSVGLSLKDTWSGMDDYDLHKMKVFRHSVPETVNMVVSERKKNNPEVHKLSTDLSVPDGTLFDMLDFYHTRLAEEKIDYAMWGHIGDNHVHMNMLPENVSELEKAKILYDEFAIFAVRLGGSIAGEHGIGRLKRHLMLIQYPEAVIVAMKELKNIFDSKNILNNGVMLP